VSSLSETATTVEFGQYDYPVEHWRQLERFAVGEECESDPRGLFRLTDDRWETWPYALNPMPSRAKEFRLYFGRFRTFLKLYVKWYCYSEILGRGGSLTVTLSTLTSSLVRADRYISEQGFRSIDEIASSAAFRSLWEAQIRTPVGDALMLPRSAVAVQENTRAFWQGVKMGFGVPHIIPPTAPHNRPKPGEFAADRSKVIPVHVIRRLSNVLGLHREKKELLSRFDHLRLCVLMLAICLGRRMNEILWSPRGSGGDGPLIRYPSKAGSPEGSLWFEFLPNKGGPGNKVLISPEWEDLALYCVRSLVRYGDEVRQFAAPEERGLLILVSSLNSTNWINRRYRSYEETITLVKPPGRVESKNAAVGRTYGLKSRNFNSWINGDGRFKGVMELWGITEDGSADGPVYRLLPSYTRHTRHDAVAVDPHVSSTALQRDLNHREPDTQFTYQHSLDETNDSLLEKIRAGKLMGRGAEWLSELLGLETQTSPERHAFKPGRPSLVPPRVLALIKSNPEFVQRNRVPQGICASPHGPAGCSEFLNCTSAAEGGCYCFTVDVDDPRMLQALKDKAAEERRLQQESASAGKVVQSQKRDTQARRTEVLRDEALRRASQETLAKLRGWQNEVEEKGL
jgi:hypothetical protein